MKLKEKRTKRKEKKEGRNEMNERKEKKKKGKERGKKEKNFWGCMQEIVKESRWWWCCCACCAELSEEVALWCAVLAVRSAQHVEEGCRGRLLGGGGRPEEAEEVPAPHTRGGREVQVHKRHALTRMRGSGWGETECVCLFVCLFVCLCVCVCVDG